MRNLQNLAPSLQARGHFFWGKSNFAVVGGWLFSTIGASGVTGLNLYSLLVAVIGAVLFLFVYHKIRRVV